MDEVGFLVNNITENGLLSLATVGCIDANILAGKSLVIKTKRGTIFGVVETPPIHLQSAEKRCENLQIKDIKLNIGCNSKKEAAEIVNLGAIVCFHANFNQFGDNLLISKALDDRIGCAILIELLKTFTKFDFCAAFTTMEETGNSGVKATLNRIKPDFAIVLESTTAADTPLTTPENTVCCLGHGPVISFMDKGTIYNREMVDFAFSTAQMAGLKIQYKRGISGTNDAKVIHTSRVKTLAVSVATRYSHSSASVASQEDIEQTFKLVKAILERLCEGRI
ncbi:MAG: M42 family peptidase [Oscillospiraceae bacterium]|jgi:endoglucanase|nr:M42 family peptidase [Oscillospiraceae bacterium]